MVENNFDTKKVMEEIKSEDSKGEVDWNFGGIVQSVSDSTKNAGSMLVSWYDKAQSTYRYIYQNNITTDEAIMPVSADNNYTLTVFNDKKEESSPNVVEHNNIEVSKDNLTVASVDIVAENVVEAKPTLKITASKQSIKVNDEVKIYMEVPHTFYPPFSLSYSGSDSAIFVMSSNLNTRSGPFADFLSTSIGTFSYTVTLTDKYNNSILNTIVLTVSGEDTAVEEEKPTPTEPVIGEKPVPVVNTIAGNYIGTYTAVTVSDNCLESGTIDKLSITIDDKNKVYGYVTLNGLIFTENGISVDNNTITDNGLSDDLAWFGNINANTITGNYEDLEDGCKGTFSVTKN